jgi:hypothetical protein
VLGSDEHATSHVTGLPAADIGFATPLATLHAFNGFADLFLTTPVNGLVDDYAFVNFALPGQFALDLAFHRYRSQSGGFDYGSEVNAVLRRPLPWKNFSVLVKVASYRADDDDPSPSVTLRDTIKIATQIEYRLNP